MTLISPTADDIIIDREILWPSVGLGESCTDIHICIELKADGIYNSTSKGKGKIHLYSASFVHTAISGAVVTDRTTVQLRHSRASPHTRTLTRAIQPQVTPVYRLNGLHLRNPCISHLLTPVEWKAELAKTQQIVYPQSGPLSTVDWAQGRKSMLAMLEGLAT